MSKSEKNKGKDTDKGKGKEKKGKDKGKEEEEEKEEKDCTLIPCPEIKNVTHPLRYYEFTQEEIKALEECDRESFYNRCLPFSTLFAALTFAAIRFGFLRRNPHFGMVPKVLGAALLGHGYGRFSSVESCKKKLRDQLPEDSHLGQTMRKYHEEETCGGDENDKDKKNKKKDKDKGKGKKK